MMVAAFVLPWWGWWLLSALALLLAALAILIWPRRQQAQVGTTTGQQPEVPTAEQAEDATACRLSVLLRRLGVEIPEGADLIRLIIQYVDDRASAERQRLLNMAAALGAKEQAEAQLTGATAQNQSLQDTLKTAGDEKTRLEAEVRRLTAELEAATEAKKRAEAALEAAKQKLAEPAPAEPLPATAAADGGKPADDDGLKSEARRCLTEMLGSDVHNLTIAAAVLEVGKSGKGFGIRRVVEELAGRGIDVTDYLVTYIISALTDPRVAVCSMQIVRLKPGIDRGWFDALGVKLPDMPPKIDTAAGADAAPATFGVQAPDAAGKSPPQAADATHPTVASNQGGEAAVREPAQPELRSGDSDAGKPATAEPADATATVASHGSGDQQEEASATIASLNLKPEEIQKGKDEDPLFIIALRIVTQGKKGTRFTKASLRQAMKRKARYDVEEGDCSKFLARMQRAGVLGKPESEPNGKGGRPLLADENDLIKAGIEL